FSNSAQGGVVWDIKNHHILRKFVIGGFEHIRGLAISPNGQLVLTGDDRKKIKLWNVNTEVLVREFEGHVSRIMHLGVASDGKRFVSVGRDKGEVLVWDLRSGASKKSPEDCPVPQRINYSAVTHSPDIRHLLLGLPDGGLLWFEVETGKTLTWKGHQTSV